MTESPASSENGSVPHILTEDVLRWLYVGRLTLVSGILVGSLWESFLVRPEQDTLLVVVMFLAALVFTTASYWSTHIAQQPAGPNLLYSQVLVDALIVTGIVHVTGGPTSGFFPLYVVVITAGALLLPLAGGLLMALLASMLYFADIAWGYQETFAADIGIRVALFTIVALITGRIGDRLRQAGQAASSELQQLRLDTADILATLSTGVVTVNGDGRLAYANHAAETLLGRPLEPLVGQAILPDLERSAPGLGEILEDAIQTGTAVSRESVAATTPNGSIRLGVSTAVLDRGPDEDPSVTALFQDITNLEHLAEMKLRNERLEAVATLSASLAHEIKNPLASIRSSVEQLGGHRIREDDREVLERLVLTETDRLSRLLSEFLDFAGLRMGPSEDVDLRALARGCLLFAKQHPDTDGVAIEGELGEDPIQIAGDADLLHRALFNLVLNGAQSAGSGGTVLVSLESHPEEEDLHGVRVDRPVRLVVEDSGPGIAAEARGQIFDPFFTTKADGSGLGLSVVHRAVQAHDGATFVEQSEMGGAQFVIFLPGLQSGPASEAVS